MIDALLASRWTAFAAGFFLSQFIRWLLDTTFGPVGYTERRYPPVRHGMRPTRPTHRPDPDIIPLPPRGGITQPPNSGRGA